MQVLLVVISALLSILSILPWMLAKLDYEFFSLVTLGLKGPVGLSLPLIYAGISVILTFFLKQGNAKITLLICSSVFFVWNLTFILIAIILT